MAVMQLTAGAGRRPHRGMVACTSASCVASPSPTLGKPSCDIGRSFVIANFRSSLKRYQPSGQTDNVRNPQSYLAPPIAARWLGLGKGGEVQISQTLLAHPTL